MARSNECAQTVVPILKFLSMKKPSAKNLAPKLHQVSEKALMHPKKLITVVWLSIKRWRDQKECAPTGVPISIFFKSGRRVNERRTNIIVSKTRTDNWKIRFNASLASCVSIENTHAPLLVIAHFFGCEGCQVGNLDYCVVQRRSLGVIHRD